MHDKQRLLTVVFFLFVGCRTSRYDDEATVWTRETKVEGEARFLAIGDWGTGDEIQRSVATLLERLCARAPLDGIFLLGDNFYEDGVQSSNDPQFDVKFDQMYSEPCLSKTTFFVVLGNHDYRGNSNAQIEYSKRNTRWFLPSRHYAVEFSTLIGVFALDTEVPDKCFLPGLCSIDWMKREMTNSNVRWKVVLGHHPLRSGSDNVRPEFAVRTALPSLLCGGGASVYLSGHAHNLQHLKGNFERASCSIEQFISGGGGAPLDVIHTPQDNLFGRSTFGALEIKGNNNSLELRFFDSTESEIYFYRLGL